MTIRASIEEARGELSMLGGIVTASEWQRAAIVAAYVLPDSGRGGPGQVGSSDALPRFGEPQSAA